MVILSLLFFCVGVYMQVMAIRATHNRLLARIAAVCFIVTLFTPMLIPKESLGQVTALGITYLVCGICFVLCSNLWIYFDNYAFFNRVLGIDKKSKG